MHLLSKVAPRALWRVFPGSNVKRVVTEYPLSVAILAEGKTVGAMVSSIRTMFAAGETVGAMVGHSFATGVISAAGQTVGALDSSIEIGVFSASGEAVGAMVAHSIAAGVLSASGATADAMVGAAV